MKHRLATFNLCNFGADASADRLQRLGQIVVQDLRSPSILAVQEVTSSEPANGLGEVSANTAYRVFAQAVVSAGGPQYCFSEVPPLAGQDGGQAGANIRVGALFDPASVELVDRGNAGPNDATDVACHNGEFGLTLSPGRIDPGHPAFLGDSRNNWVPSRKAMAIEFRIAGRPLFVIVCHLKSMRAANRRAEANAKKQRHAQAGLIHGFVARILGQDPTARVVVLGDMNDVTGSQTLRLLKGKSLDNLLEDVHKADRYTRRHGSRLQALDHVLVSASLRRGAKAMIPHANTDCSDETPASDHDPVLAELDLAG